MNNFGNRKQRRFKKYRGANRHAIDIQVGRQAVTVDLYSARIAAVHSATVQKIFGVTEDFFPAYKRKSENLKQLRDSMLRHLGSLFQSHQPSKYFNELRETVDLAGKVEEAAEDFRTNVLTDRFDEYASGLPRFIPDRLRNSIYFRRFAANPQRAANKHSREVVRAYAESITDEIMNWLSLPEGTNIHLDQSQIQRFYQPIVDAVFLSQLYMVIRPLREFLETTLEVARQGNPSAAHMFFVESARNLHVYRRKDVDQQVNLLINQLSLPLARQSLFMDSEMYVRAVQLGVFNAIEALDRELTPNRTANPLRVVCEKFFDRLNMSSVISLGESLDKLGIRPELLGELLVETPIGARADTFKYMRKNLDYIVLFNSLKQGGASARSYMAFRQTSDYPVSIEGQRYTRMQIVNDLAQHRPSVATWVALNPDFWDQENLEARLTIAERGRSPEARLELLKTWSQYPGVQDVILSNVSFSDRKLGDILNRITALPKEAWTVVNSQNIDEVVSDYSLKKDSVSKPSSWIDDSYAGTPEADFLHAAYAALSAARADYRLSALHDYLEEHVPEESRGGFFEVYAQNLGSMPTELLSIVFGNNRFFQDETMFHGLNMFLSDEETVEEAIKVYESGRNVLAYLQQTFTSYIPTDVGLDVVVQTVDNEVLGQQNIPVRITVLGAVSVDVQKFIDSRVKDPAIEIVYITDSNGSTLPDTSDGTIVYTYGIGHSSPEYARFANSANVVRPSNGGRTGLLRDIESLAVELRRRMNET